MARPDIERDVNHPSWHRRQAAELRRQADQLSTAGYRDQAARHLLEARLHDLRAAASASTTSWAA